MPRSRRLLANAALVLVLIAILPALRTLRLDAMGHYLSTQRYEDRYYVPPPQFLHVFSLGYDEALADLLWLRALIYYADELQHRGEVAHVFDYAEAMLTLDPHFKAVYRWVATASLYRTGTITAADARRAIAFLERGVRRFPDDGELAWDLGATYRFELVPLLDDAQAREEARRKGLEHLEVAARRGAGPPWLVLNNAAKLEELGRKEQAIRHLEEIYATVREPDVREQIRLRLAKLRSEAYAEAFQRANQQLEVQRQAEFPYLPTPLYLLVGPRPPFDGWALRARKFDPVETQLIDADPDPAAARASAPQ